MILKLSPKAAEDASLQLASWWTFSDLLDEGWLTGQPFYGGFGLLNSYGVRKPSYRAFELLHHSGQYYLPNVSVHDPDPDYPKVRNHSTVAVLATVDDGDDNFPLIANADQSDGDGDGIGDVGDPPPGCG